MRLNGRLLNMRLLNAECEAEYEADWPNMRLNGGLNVRMNVGWVGEWEVRLLNVRLNMKLTVWPTMRLNVRLSMKLTVWPNMRLNGRLNRRLNVRMNVGWEVRLLNVRLNMKLTVWPTMRLNGRLLNVMGLNV